MSLNSCPLVQTELKLFGDATEFEPHIGTLYSAIGLVHCSLADLRIDSPPLVSDARQNLHVLPLLMLHFPF